MHPRFRRPVNAHAPRGPPRPSNRQWQSFEGPPFRQRPPYIPFAPPHVAQPFPPVGPQVGDCPPYPNNNPGNFDSRFPRAAPPPFRNYRPNYANPMHCPENADHRPFARPPGFQPSGRGSWRGRGEFGRGMKRFPERDGDVPKKKRKIKDKPTPESCRFYCETCDRGYRVEEKYSEHLSTHIQCGWDGCRYVAAAKLVQIHRDQQHRTGLAKKIWQLETREDIDKWIAERKRNYPTKDTVARKQQQLEDKIRRGEVLETKQFGRFGRGRGRGRGWHHRNRGQQQAEETSQVTAIDGGTQRRQNNTTDAEDPLSFGMTSEHLNSDSDEEQADDMSSVVNDENNVASVDSSTLSGALGSIMSSYTADSDVDQVDSNETKQLLADAEKSKSRTAENKRKRQQKKRERNNNSVAQNARSRRQSLLEKLLANEIRHERNVLLQCIRYIVQHNFFQVAPMSDMNSEKIAPNGDSVTNHQQENSAEDMTNKSTVNKNAAKLDEEDPHVMTPPGEEQEMEVSEEPTVEEVSDSDMPADQPQSPVIIEDISNEAMAQGDTDEMKSSNAPDVNLQDVGDMPVVQDPEAVVIEDISGDPEIEELSDVVESGDSPKEDKEMSDDEHEGHPIVQDVADKPVIQDPPGTPVILDITGFPKIKDLSDPKRMEEKADSGDEGNDDEREDDVEAGLSSSSSLSGDEEAIVEDVVDEPLVQDPVDTPIIRDVTSLPNIRDACDSPLPPEASSEPSSESEPEAAAGTRTDKPIVLDESEEPFVQDPSETPLIQDISNQLVIQDVTNSDSALEDEDEHSDEEHPPIRDPSPIVQDVPDEPVEEGASDSEKMDSDDIEDTIIIQDVSDQTPVRDQAEMTQQKTDS